METRIKKGKTENGEIAELTVDKNNKPIFIKVPSINGGQKIPIEDLRDKIIASFENVIFDFPKSEEENKHNKVITPRQFVAFVEKNTLNIGVITQYVRAGVIAGKTLITQAYRCSGAYPFGKKGVRGRLTICYCHDSEGNIRIILNYYVYKNQQEIPEGEVEKEVSFKVRGTLNKTVFSLGIPGEKNMVLVEKTKKERVFPTLCA